MNSIKDKKIITSNITILDEIKDNLKWKDFFDRKLKTGNLSKEEENELEIFILEKKYDYYYELIKKGEFPKDYPKKSIINKVGTNKKRIVYSYDIETNIVLKFIAHRLYVYDYIFSRNCYSFRREYGVKNAIRRLKNNIDFGKKYCFKADISNYFNSIDIEKLLEKLQFLKETDVVMYNLFEKMLKEDRVYDKGQIISEKQGAMAGTPCSPFFANIYLSDVDKYYEDRKKEGIEYFRYSDDILIFANTYEQLNESIELFKEMITNKGLYINNDKMNISKPGEKVDFLGFSYCNGEIDISEITKKKLKAKIKRKSNALRRWARNKEIDSKKAAKGFIKAMNRKFYGKDYQCDKYEFDNDIEQDFTWCRWFFPNITVDKSLREIDKYMQEYIRYIITGRHYKGNYKITYKQMKELGYKSLVHEYYAFFRKI